MNRIILLLVSVFFLVSCKQENTKSPSRKHISKSSSVTKTTFLNKNISEDEIIKHLIEKYSDIYMFEMSSDDEAEGKELQYLAINYLENKNIDFYLYTETLPCDTEYFGVAVKENQHDNSTIFSKEENEFKISIQLNEDKSEATIFYIQKDSLETDCIPIDQIIMKKVK